jgi:hypothetical protein
MPLAYGTNFHREFQRRVTSRRNPCVFRVPPELTLQVNSGDGSPVDHPMGPEESLAAA